MIRKATLDDIEQIEDTYNEHFAYESEHRAFTVFKKGIYPTVKDAEKAINSGTLYVYEEKGVIAGSIIIDKIQPKEYAKIAWKQTLPNNEIAVIHLLLIRPSMAGKGIGTTFVEFAAKYAKSVSCKVLRLDTGSQNTPAVSLYLKSGFQIVATDFRKVGDAIEHKEHLFLEKAL